MEVIVKISTPDIGKRIKAKRLEHRLTPAKVAAEASMSVSNLYLIESQRCQAIPEETLKRLSDAIGYDFVNEVQKIYCQTNNS